MRADSISMRRRHLIIARFVGAAAPGAVFAGQCGGVRAEGHASMAYANAPASEEEMIVSGRIISTDCNPVAAAVVEVWQASYGSHQTTTVTTDGDGRFMFATHAPAQRGRRYVKYRVTHSEHATVVSQLHFAPVSGVSDDDIALLQRDYAGVWRTTFGLTLA
ncbi:MAG: hypothetical protein ACXWIP_08915 [Burkholderiales bacterium]